MVSSVADWQSTVRNYPGPWAELVLDKFVLTVPGTLAQTMDNPDELMTFWNDEMDAAAILNLCQAQGPGQSDLYSMNKLVLAGCIRDTRLWPLLKPVPNLLT